VYYVYCKICLKSESNCANSLCVIHVNGKNTCVINTVLIFLTAILFLKIHTHTHTHANTHLQVTFLISKYCTIQNINHKITQFSIILHSFMWCCVSCALCIPFKSTSFYCSQISDSSSIISISHR